MSSLYNQFKDENYDLVKIITEKENKGTYIIKSFKGSKKYILKIRESTNNYQKEIYNKLSMIKCNNLIKIKSFTEDKYCYLIYEYIEGCNLLEYLKGNQNILEEDIKSIIIQIVTGLSILHNNNILHCDLKLENIIITKDKIIKIIDFDLSIICENCDGFIANSIFGTLQYIAPESYDLCIYSKKTDIWQLGIIIYILISSRYPHESELSAINSYSNLCRINRFKHINLDIIKEIIIKKNYDPRLYSLLSKMLKFDEKDRFTASQIMSSSYLQNI